MFNDPSKVLPHPDAAYEQKVPGVIEALHLPDGGIIRHELYKDRSSRKTDSK